MKAISSLLLLAFSIAFGQAPEGTASPAVSADSTAAPAPPDTIAADEPVAAPSAPAEPEPVLEEGEEEEDMGALSSPDAELAFLIPADGDVLFANDVKVVAHVQGPTPAGMLAVLDGYSLDRPLRLEEGMLSVELPGLRPGVHEVKMIFLDAQQQIQLSRTVRFFVRIPEPKRKPAAGKLRQFGRVSTRMDWKGAESRGRVVEQAKLGIRNDSMVVGEGKSPISQDIDGAVEASYSVKYGFWEGYLKGLLRADENEFRQPSHRLSGRISLGPWATLRGGDIYPAYNNLILNGTRIRGMEANAALVTGGGENHWIYAKVAEGETRREIPSYQITYDTGNGNRLDTVTGTHSQRLTAFRLGGGGGKGFDLALTMLRASERTGDSAYRTLNDTLHGPQPTDNLVTGLDTRIGFWEGRIQVYGDLALSLYTRDRSIGPLVDSAGDLPIDPKDIKNVVVLNATTKGLQNLLSNDSVKADFAGFLGTNSAWNAGITSSIPFAGLVSETEIKFSHLGMDYHSEGNPFLGTNPGRGYSLQQRLVAMENRLFLGVEVASFLQELGLYKQEERALKGEIRYLPGAYRPAFWLSGGFTTRAPKGSYPYQFNQDFVQLNAGGFHQKTMGPGKLHGTLLYGFTRSELEMSSNNPADSLLVFPPTQSHIVNNSMQYKFRGSDLMPKLSYTFASNGVQEPTHNLAAGVQNTFFRQRLRGDFDVLVGQYPASSDKNDLSIGETFSLLVRVGEHQSVRFREKWVQYGERASITAGAYYESFF